MGLQSMLHSLHHTKEPVAVPLIVSGDKLSRKTLFQNRYQWGPNFGGMFVLEKWIDNSLFNEQATGDSELDALVGYEKSGKSLEDTQKAWEHHWKGFITDDDWKYLVDHGVTAIRLPIGYWNVNGGYFARKTPFEKYAKVYKNSWDYIKELIKTADKHDIGVLVDIHAVPGGANADSHSGTTGGKAEFWEHSHYRDETLSLYEYVAKDLHPFENVVGIQLLNEAVYGQAKTKAFYVDAIARIRKVDPSVPIVISDAWDLASWRKTVHEWNESASSKTAVGNVGVVVDTHVYRMFSEADKKRSADELVQSCGEGVAPDDDVDTMVGEYSNVLSEESWNQCSNRDQLEVQYGLDQNRNFEKCARAGAYFWTYKFAQGPGGGWDFRVMSDKGGLPKFARKVDSSKPDLDSLLKTSFDQHKNYWDGQSGGQDYEHWRFEEGFKQGFADAKKFADFNGSRVGRVAALKAARATEHIKHKGNSDKIWVFTQAYVQGADAFWNAL